MKNALSFIVETAKVVIIAFLIVWPIRAFVFQPFLVKGDSMKPNFHNGDYVIVDELSYRLRSPERGEAIVLKFPLNTSERFIKRIIGLPGETVEIQNNAVTISKEGKSVVLHESYLPQALQTPGNQTIALKENQYFVMGDNRPNSSDSRTWGVVPKQDIVGRVLVRVFPPSAFALIPAPSY